MAKKWDSINQLPGMTVTTTRDPTLATRRPTNIKSADVQGAVTRRTHSTVTGSKTKPKTTVASTSTKTRARNTAGSTSRPARAGSTTNFDNKMEVRKKKRKS